MCTDRLPRNGPKHQPSRESALLLKESSEREGTGRRLVASERPVTGFSAQQRLRSALMAGWSSGDWSAGELRNLDCSRWAMHAREVWPSHLQVRYMRGQAASLPAGRVLARAHAGLMWTTRARPRRRPDNEVDRRRRRRRSRRVSRGPRGGAWARGGRERERHVWFGA